VGAGGRLRNHLRERRRRIDALRLIHSDRPCLRFGDLADIRRRSLRRRTLRALRRRGRAARPPLRNVLRVIHVHRHVMIREHLAEQLEQRRIVGLQIIRALQPRRAVEPLVVRPEPPLHAFRPVLVRVRRRVVTLVFPFGHRVRVRRFDRREERRIRRADAAAHDRVPELVDQDVLAVVACPRIPEEVLLRARRRIPAEPARAAIPVLLVGHLADAVFIVRALAGREHAAVERRLLSIAMLRDVRRHFRNGHDADAPAFRDQRVAYVLAFREHVDHDVARDEQCRVRCLLGADDRNAHRVRVLLVERIVAERRRHRGDVGLHIVVDQRLVLPVLRGRRDERRREHHRTQENRVSHGHHRAR
jgi:hypothetical protein